MWRGGEGEGGRKCSMCLPEKANKITKSEGEVDGISSEV